jgi:UDP-N-acetylglucosamine 2-epimerase (non-hydrolysing)
MENIEVIRTAKILTVVGARPNFMKAAPIIAAIRNHNERLEASPRPERNVESHIVLENVLVHTGQHYDEAMSDRFFADLNIPKPDVHLGAGSGSHAIQTAEIMKRFEEVLLQEKPDVLVVVGDVNSTVACALVAAKISYDAHGTRPLIAHVEAGLRSFDRSMPEETNRVVTDHLADLLFVTEESGLKNLREEGIPHERVHLVGNTMIDSLLAFRHQARSSQILEKLNLRASDASNGSTDNVARYALLTLHRPSNVDQRETFLNILKGLEELSKSCPVVFPVHPRARQRIREFGLESFFSSENTCPREESCPTSANGIRLIDPLGYIDFLCLMDHADIVVTDSGGIQEETTCLGVRCVTVRNNTERPVTVQLGTNILAGTAKDGIRRAIRKQLDSKAVGAVPETWDGKSAQRIIAVISAEIEKKQLMSTHSVPVEESEHVEVRQ